MDLDLQDKLRERRRRRRQQMKEKIHEQVPTNSLNFANYF